MNLKSRILGFGAAAVLSLSMFAGAMAATTTDVQITFESAGCSIAVDATGGNQTLGIWTWNDANNNYELGTETVTINYTAKKSAPNISSCAYKISLKDGVMKGTNQENTIAAGLFAWENNNLNPDASVDPARTNGSFRINKNDPAFKNITPDTYTGTLNFTATTGA